MSLLEVSVAIIQKPNGDVLFAQRPANKPYAGYWEFPGGKIEAAETPLQALYRELNEELAIEISTALPWLTRTFNYTHATVRLHFYKIRVWRGNPHANENQILSWQNPHHMRVSPLLPANQPIVRALCLPSVYAISNVRELGIEAFLASVAQALKNGLRMLVLRESQMDVRDAVVLMGKLRSLAETFGARVLIHSDTPLGGVACDGIHFSAKALMQLTSRPEIGLVAASCHTAEELAHAADLEVDFVVLSPVLPTISHPGAPCLGWDGFAALIENYSVPAYALGGMKKSLLPKAYQVGAQGIAMLRGAWEG